MKTPTEKKWSWAILFLLLVMFAGGTAYPEQGGVTQIYKNAKAPFDNQKSVTSVIALPKETVLVRALYQGERFWTETRKDKIERFKCSQCHNTKPFRVA